MITYLLYKFKVLREGDALSGFASLYTMTIDLLIVVVIGTLIYNRL